MSPSDFVVLDEHERVPDWVFLVGESKPVSKLNTV
jgi:hypothetical protein